MRGVVGALNVRDVHPGWSDAAPPALAILNTLPRASDYVIAGTFPDQPRADLKKPWKAVSNRAGLTGVRIHDLRHTHASVGAGAG